MAVETGSIVNVVSTKPEDGLWKVQIIDRRKVGPYSGTLYMSQDGYRAPDEGVVKATRSGIGVKIGPEKFILKKIKSEKEV